jgi:hypothetical protein
MHKNIGAGSEKAGVGAEAVRTGRRFVGARAEQEPNSAPAPAPVSGPGNVNYSTVNSQLSLRVSSSSNSKD